MGKLKLKFGWLLLALLSFNSCKKEPGYGGSAGIKGVLKLNNYNKNYTTIRETKTLADEFVYIIFQDGKGYGDRVKTSYDGSFLFTHLRPGKYKIYAYSDDISMQTADKIIVLKEIEIKKNKELVDAGEITIATNTILKGNATIKGRVFAHKDGDTFFAMNEKVFIVYDGDQTYTKYVFTDDQGEFQFENMPVGNHRIFVYSKNTSDNVTAPKIPVEVYANLTANNEVKTLPDFDINK